jgi:hypothetical protein
MIKMHREPARIDSKTSLFALSAITAGLKQAIASGFSAMRGNDRRAPTHGSPRRSMSFETLESRFLLSADLAPVAQQDAPALQHMPVLQQSLLGDPSDVGINLTTSEGPIAAEPISSLPEDIIRLAGDELSISDHATTGADDPLVGSVVRVGTVNISALRPLLAAALDRLGTLGFAEEQFSAALAATVSVTDLPGARLALSADRHTWIDSDAGGYGWFIDATPGDDGEYPLVAGSESVARVGAVH